MPKPDKPALRPTKTPIDFRRIARACYGPAFGARNPRALERARDDWADLTDEDRAFALAHLLYLNLMAQAASVRLQTQTRDLLDEIAEGLAGEEPEGAVEEPAFAPAEAPLTLAEALGEELGEVGDDEEPAAEDGDQAEAEADDGSAA
ncbi:MAG: hypothetical protein ABIO70_12110 [Pseudomonadota bacterium]